jgi:myo-inositol-1(or 4)-monophosphatase
MTPFIQAAIEANEEIARTIEEQFLPSWYEKTVEGAGGDVSSRLDLYAEEVFVKYLEGFGRIESEESGIIGEGENQIILDPIDGSANAMSAFPYFGSSVAMVNAEGVLEAAIVCNFATKEIFIKSAGMSTVCGKLFEKGFHPPVVVPGAEIGLFEKAYANPELVAALDREGLKFRAPGAIALSLAYAHSVNYVLFMGEFRIYDFAAGLALCEGLEVIVEQDYVIVSKEKSVADKIEALIKENKKRQGSR